jgi:tRNA (adenine57-N1/adenine58-N1)-methyltransferase
MIVRLWRLPRLMVERGRLRDGDAVVLIDGRGRRYLKRLRAGHRITVRSVVIEADGLIDAYEGSLAGRGEAERFRVFRATFAEIASAIDRPAEPIFAKDAGTILIRAGIGAGTRVIEAGVGAGTLTVALLSAIGVQGRLASYELREDFAEVARRNVAAYFGEASQWKLTVRDAREGFDERGFDALVADLPDPDILLDPAAAALRPGGMLVSYVPTVLQVKQFHDAFAGDERYASLETLEVLERSWQVSGRSIRPDHRMIAHTGFLSFARRTSEGHSV